MPIGSNDSGNKHRKLEDEMFTFTTGLIGGFIGGVLVAYYAPKLWARITNKVGKAADKVKEKL